MGLKSSVALLLAILFIQDAYVSPATSIEIFSHTKEFGDVIEYDVKTSMVDKVLSILKNIVFFPFEVMRFVISPFVVPAQILVFIIKALLFPIRLLWMAIMFPVRFIF